MGSERRDLKISMERFSLLRYKTCDQDNIGEKGKSTDVREFKNYETGIIIAKMPESRAQCYAIELEIRLMLICLP